MSENHLNNHFKSILNTYCKMQRVEPSFVNTSFPDWYITFPSCKILIEAKHVREWPKRATTGIKFKRYTPGQKRFIFTHGRFGRGGVFILVQVGDDIMLFTWHYAYKIVGMTKADCLKNCCFHWKRSERKWRSKQFKEELIEILTTN